mmetsp:Transcript_3526/g.3677  ORF Transcript_3526/g.3677 Transcript_3526/m.3677 type:complete len:231 (+) Transcript_3526:761-1453(+)
MSLFSRSNLCKDLRPVPDFCFAMNFFSSSAAGMSNMREPASIMLLIFRAFNMMSFKNPVSDLKMSFCSMRIMPHFKINAFEKTSISLADLSSFPESFLIFSHLLKPKQLNARNTRSLACEPHNMTSRLLSFTSPNSFFSFISSANFTFNSFSLDFFNFTSSTLSFFNFSSISFSFFAMISFSFLSRISFSFFSFSIQSSFFFLIPSSCSSLPPIYIVCFGGGNRSPPNVV